MPEVCALSMYIVWQRKYEANRTGKKVEDAQDEEEDAGKKGGKGDKKSAKPSGGDGGGCALMWEWQLAEGHGEQAQSVPCSHDAGAIAQKPSINYVEIIH